MVGPVPTIRIVPAVDCWITVTDATGRIQFDNLVRSRVEVQMVTAPRPLEVRSGCPGQLAYEVDGAKVSPANRSKKPEKSEVVSLP
jgi:hypothetical protein